MSTGEPGPGVVVLVHPGALPATSYGPLADALGARTELLVVDLERDPAYRAMTLGVGEHAVSVTGLAELVVEALRPSTVLGRTWLLAGWSLGGVVAYAATALLDDHHLPRHLVVLDSIAPVTGYRRCTAEALFSAGGEINTADLAPEVLLTWFTGYLATKRGGRLELPAGTLRGLDTDAGLELVLREAIQAGLLWPEVSLAGLRKVFDVYRSGLSRNIALTSSHRAAPARVPMTLVRPEAGLLDTAEALFSAGGEIDTAEALFSAGGEVDTADPLGWQRLAAELDVVRCPGNHYSMLSESSLIAGVLSERLSGQRARLLPAG